MRSLSIVLYQVRKNIPNQKIIKNCPIHCSSSHSHHCFFANYYQQHRLSSSTVTQKDRKDDDDDDDDDDLEDKNKNKSLLGGNPQPDPLHIIKNTGGKSGITNRKNILTILPLAWGVYKSTWEGFFDNHGKYKKDLKKAEEEEDGDDDDEPMFDAKDIKKKQKEVRKNIGRNVNFLKEEGSVALENAKDITGIRNKNDLMKWSMKQLKLANECVAEFMKGYRYGRDQEIDNVMNEYFKDIEFEDDNDKTSANEEDENVMSNRPIRSGRRKRRRKSLND